jgi:hypothetical protein
MNKLEHALHLARKGHANFPCDPRSKAPLTPHGFKDATCNVDTITKWWTQRSDALIGVPTARFAVIDADLQHAAAQHWYGSANLPTTRTHYTRSGGRHTLFKPHPLFPCSAGKLWQNIDTRGLNPETGKAGGNIIWWPAEGLEVIHPDKLAPVPDWIIAKLNPPPRAVTAYVVGDLSSEQAQRKLDGIIRAIATAPQGQCQCMAFWGACRLAEMVSEKLISRDEVTELVIEAASRTGLSRKRALSAVRSAFKTIGV